MDLLCLADPCNIELKYNGKEDALADWSGYLKVNGLEVAAPGERGISVATIEWNDGVCHAENSLTFDTYSLQLDDGTALSNWLGSLAPNTIVVGYATDEASRRIDDASDALSALGVDVSTLEFRWRLAFVARVGHPTDAEVLV